MNFRLDDALIVWNAAILSGFAREPEWVEWADHHIGALSDPPLWIIDLSLAHDVIVALAAISNRLQAVSNSPWENVDAVGLQIGFIFLRFERGDIAMLTALEQAGMAADPTRHRPSCEKYYMLANELEDTASGMAKAKKPAIEQRVANLFRPDRDAAKNWWDRLFSYKLGQAD